MKTVAIIEARMGSSRLPGKTLMDVAGKTLLDRVLDRIRLARTVDELVVATTTNSLDDPLSEHCLNQGIACFRGSEEDVLGRVYNAAVKSGAGVVVQCGADCPFYDPNLIDLLVYALKLCGYAYAANDMKLTFPEGVDAHIIRFDALESSAREAFDPRERDDTPRFIWNHSERFSIYNLEALPESILNRPEIRLTVDYPEDMELARLIYATFSGNTAFTTFEVLRLLDTHPDWLRLNQNCEQISAAYVQ